MFRILEHRDTHGGDALVIRTFQTQGFGGETCKDGLTWEDVPPNVRRAYRMLARALLRAYPEAVATEVASAPGDPLREPGQVPGP